MENITDKIFKIVDILKASGKIRFYTDVCRAIEIDKENFNAVKNKKASLTIKQLYYFINTYNVNANYIFKNDPNIFGTNVEQKPKKSDFSLFSIN